MSFRTKIRNFCGLAACLAFAGCATVPSGNVAEGTTAIVGADVIPMTDSTTVLHDQTVIVSEGRIARMGPRQSVAVPGGATRIDGRGRFLIPGLADMHVHLEHDDDPGILALFLAHGVTTVRNMDGRPNILDWRQRVAAGDLPGPRIVTSGPIIDGSPPLRDDNLAVADPEAARAAVQEQAAAGYDFIKVYTNLSPAAYRAVRETARAEGLAVAGHVPREIPLAEAMRGQRSIEHLADYGDAIDTRRSGGTWHWSDLYLAMAADAERITALADELGRAEVWTVPTMIQSERGAASAEQVETWLRDPDLALVPADARDFWARQGRRTATRLDAGDLALLARGRRNRMALVGALDRAGAGILAGTDTPNPFVIPGISLHEELTLLVEAGLTPGEALLTATRDAARFLGEVAEWGRIAPRAQADLILLAENPLADIRRTRRIEGVMRRGRWLGSEELRALSRALID